MLDVILHARRPVTKTKLPDQNQLVNFNGQVNVSDGIYPCGITSYSQTRSIVRLTASVEVSFSTMSFDPEMIYHVTNRGYGSVKIWGCVFGGMKSPLVRINGRLTSETLVTF